MEENDPFQEAAEADEKARLLRFMEDMQAKYLLSRCIELNAQIRLSQALDEAATVVTSEVPSEQ